MIVQQGLFITRDCCETIIAKPLVLGDQTSLTHLQAIMQETSALGLDLQTLAASYDRVLWHFGMDGAATCELAIDYLKCAVAGMGNVTVLDSSLCFMHALNRVAADHVASSTLDLNGIFSLTKLMYIGSYFDTFSKAVIKEALSDFHWEQLAGPPLTHGEQHERVVRLCCPDLHQRPRRARDVRWALGVLNGRWDKKTVSHHCALSSESRLGA